MVLPPRFQFGYCFGLSALMASAAEDFENSELDTIPDVFGLTPSDPLDTFAEMWYQVFLWALFSSLFVHVAASLISCFMLRRHKYGRFTSLLILLFGILSPLSVGVVTSAAIAGVYRSSRFQMKASYALVWGLGQTVLGAVMAFTRILATL